MALDRYKHIELTPEETTEAILWAKQRKEDRIRKEELERRASENRKALTSFNWSFNQTRDFMLVRANDLFKGNFTLDPNNDFVFRLLCYYFSEDVEFISLCSNIGAYNPSLSKGIMLSGNFGVGKTWMLRLFGKNKRQVFKVLSAKEIANAYEEEGQPFIDEYVEKPKNAINDAASFFHTYMGICIDDIGTEDIKTHFGNKKNVIGDLIELRYNRGNTGVLLHGTTNLTAKQLTDFYGGRVASRMREIFNFIELPGGDRRI